ncbi:MAG TPA: VOC family protein [Silvibacterium sp.]|nr:VOC family protein [Silvibacterium sp.]
MNTEAIVHPKLLHYGLTTADMDAMADWYRKVLGMKLNHRSKIPAIARLTRHAPPFSGFSFVSNDERDHRIVFFQIPGATVDPEKRRHTGLQHVAFEYASLDDLLGTYLRLKGLGIVPLWAADHGVAMAFYYEDPDQNVVELNVNNFGEAWTATEYLETAASGMPAQVDPEKMVVARQAGASLWEIHKRAAAGEFAPAEPFNPAARF